MENIELINIINDLIGIIVVFIIFEAVTPVFIDDNLMNYYIDKKVIIAIDSLEHFIKEDEVFNQDIVDICHLIDVFINDENEFYEGLLPEVFSNIVKFIIAFRDTTEKMLPTRNGEDVKNCEVNLTEWFPPAFIFNKRRNYFKNAEGFQNDRIIKTIETIMNDDIVNYGFFGKVLEMHNYNKRRMFQYICGILTEDVATQYLLLWEKALKYEKLKETCNNARDRLNYNKLSQTYKNAARSSIIRLLFDQIAKVNYFKNISSVGVTDNVNADKTESVNDKDEFLGKSYVRRILTYICAKKQEENVRESENYVSFNDLLRNAFRIKDIEANSGTVGDIAQVLINMSNSKRSETNWCQLLVIKFNNSTYDKNSLVNQMINSFTANNNQDLVNYGIKVTSAGRFFLTKLSDFEYFSCRYAKYSLPLFFDANLKKVDGQFFVLSMIETIKIRAFDCIDKIMTLDVNTFQRNYAQMYSGGNPEKKGYLYVLRSGKEMTHVQRILDSHISYLDFYRNHILELELSEDDKLKLSMDILDIIRQYVNKLKDIVLEDPDHEGVYYIGYRRLTDRSGYAFYNNYEVKLVQAQRAPLEHIWIQK